MVMVNVKKNFLDSKANRHIYVTEQQMAWFKAEMIVLGLKSGAILFDKMKAGYILAKAIMDKIPKKGVAND
jgi:hypothetical protein